MHYISSGHGNVSWYYHTSIEEINKKQSVLEQQTCTKDGRRGYD